MPDKKLSDEAIIKALECCGNQMYVCTDKQCRAKTSGNAVDLIKSQKAEIEKLKGSTIVNNIMECNRIKREAKAEAYVEFAERLKLYSYIMSDQSQTGIINKYSVVTVNQIDNLLKEMVGEKE